MTDEINVSFRLPSPYSELLRQASKSSRLSPHTFARYAVISALDSGQHSVVGRLAEIERELRLLREDFNQATEVSPLDEAA